MAGLKDIRIRIGSVRSTRKITSAMKMVSAAKFHRAQSRHSHNQYFFSQFQRLMGIALAQGIRPVHPLMGAITPNAPTLFLVLTSNGSMCGGYNNAVVQLVQGELQHYESEQNTFDVWAFGRKGGDMLSKSGVTLGRLDEALVEAPSYEAAMKQYEELQKQFAEGHYAKIVLAYNLFRTAATQEPVFRQLFPIDISQLPLESAGQEYIFEPSVEDFFAYALPHYARLLFWGALLDNAIGEQGARMTAMTQATDNADTLLDDLTLEYNKERQSAITNELVEIVSGASALNG